MAKTQNHKHIVLIIVLSLFVLAACAPETVVRIVVTPTPQPNQEEGSPSAEATSQAQVIPTIDSASVPTLDRSAIATVTPTPETPPTEITAGGEGFGPFVNPDYVISPTVPRPATATPTESPVTIEPTIPPADTLAPGTPIPQLDNSKIGLQLYYNMPVSDWAQVLTRTEWTKVGWVKLQANWAFLQPNHRDEFEQNFGLFQLHVQEAEKRGFKVLISIAKAPAWARSNQGDDGPPDDPQALVYFINFMLDKIGPHIDAIEVWNEPNLQREWTGTLEFSGAGYMQLFRPAYQAIRSYSPDLTIVTAGLAPTSAPGQVDDRVFLQQMYNAGLAQYRDIVVGIHPYGWGNAPDARCCDLGTERGWDDNPHFYFWHNIEDMRNIMVNNGHGDVKMWATEFGWATWQGMASERPQEWMDYNTPQLQADYTIRAIEIAQSLDYLGVMFLWNLNFANESVITERNEVAGYSLLLPPYQTGGPPQERPLYQLLVNRP